MKRLLTTLSQKWPEYILEILVLVIGIYGAFALEEWNENRKDISKKHLIIKNIKGEFESNLDQLNRILDYDRKAIAACQSLLALINEPVIPNSQKLDSIFNRMYALWSFDPSSGALKSAISSGEIHLIRDEMLKDFLFSWEGMTLDAQEEEQRFIENLQSKFPAFQDRVRLANVLHEYDGRVPRSRFQSDYDALLRDKDFENFLADHLTYLLDAEGELEVLSERISDIINLLDQE